MARSQLLETLEIIRQIPRQAAGGTNQAVRGHGNDDGNEHKCLPAESLPNKRPGLRFRGQKKTTHGTNAPVASQTATLNWIGGWGSYPSTLKSSNFRSFIGFFTIV